MRILSVWSRNDSCRPHTQREELFRIRHREYRVSYRRKKRPGDGHIIRSFVEETDALSKSKSLHSATTGARGTNKP